MLKKKIIEKVIISDGYYDKFVISKKETKLLYEIIKQNFLSIVLKQENKNYEILEKIHLKDYHKYSNLINHENIMQKKNRLIKPKYLIKIKKMKFFKKLKLIFTNFKILNFEKIYNEEIDWRVVRPRKSDTSPLHRDEWFWSLNKRKKKKDCTRVKIWVPIFCEKGKNGLNYVPKSHKSKILFKNKTLRKDGLIKPGLINKRMDIKIFKSKIGQCFIFNDRLVHGGLSGGKKTRISLEFTMLIKNKEINKSFV